MARIDHAAEARSHLNAARRVDELSPEGHLMAAQVEATLALVEQQKIANLIALANSANPNLHHQVAADAVDTLTVHREHDENEMGGWREATADIAAALGIEVQS